MNHRLSALHLNRCRPSFFRLLCWQSLLGLFMGLSFVTGVLPTLMAAPPKPIKPGPRPLVKLEEEYLSKWGGDSAPFKVGDKVTITIQSGRRYEDLELTELQLGKQSNSLGALAGKTSKGEKLKPAISSIISMEAGERRFEVVQQTSTKAHFLLDQSRRNELAEQRIKDNDDVLWTDPTPEEREEEITELKEMCQQVSKAFPDRKFLSRETEFFLIHTDMPANQIAGYISKLDSMYQQLCAAFSIPSNKNIWLGKGMIFVFTEKRDFARFEKEFMENDDIGGSQGMNHGEVSGRNITAFYRGDDPAFFAALLVHETSHGFVHRFRSSVTIDSWVDEGIADWIANVCVPASRDIELGQADAIATLRRTGSLGENFLEPDAKFDSTQYAYASLLTDFMVRKDPQLYRAFISGMKDGHTAEEALKGTYGISVAELIQHFGRSLGVPNLKP